MPRLFGTDGVRGLANVTVTAELAVDLSVAAAHVLAETGELVPRHGRRPRAVVGRDTRASGEFLEAAVVAGLASAGVDVQLLGVVPTPAAAYLTGSLDADLGVMLSASHNPMPDNGIKFLARGGVKLADALEMQIEHRLREPWTRPTGADVGRVTTYDAAVSDYAAHLDATLHGRLPGMRVVLDCAHGAAYLAGPKALRDAGAEVVAICDRPDGLNINAECGSTHLDLLRRAVIEHEADLGFALDGDADRCLAVDHTGEVVDGDQIMAMLAIGMRARGLLAHDTVVATVMSNLGFSRALTEHGIELVRTDVGDRYVLEAMKAGGFTLGGEQSGHVIMSGLATTGDGILTALHVLERMAETGASLRDLARVVTRLPQVLVNVTGVDKSRLGEPAVEEAVAAARAELDGSGRILLRPSGTEPLVRVMVEAATAEHAQEVADRLAGVVRERLAL